VTKRRSSCGLIYTMSSGASSLSTRITFLLRCSALFYHNAKYRTFCAVLVKFDYRCVKSRTSIREGRVM
jgi:hypothetical protein